MRVSQKQQNMSKQLKVRKFIKTEDRRRKSKVDFGGWLLGLIF